MKAIVWTKYGAPDGLKLREVAKPTPNDHEVLIKIHTTTVTAADCELRAFHRLRALWLPLRIYFGLFRPTRVTILGQELSGEIESVGKDVTKFKAGDPVYAWSALRMGGYAEYTCLSENAMMAIKPVNMTHAEAAPIPVGGLEAWHYLSGTIKAGQEVLIIGAGGSIGTFGVQVAKLRGAEVTAVDISAKFDMLRSIGADHLIDYTREDFTKSRQLYDVIFDAPGKSSFSRCRRSLKPGGRFLSANPGTFDRLRTMLAFVTRRKSPASEQTVGRREEFMSLRDVLEAGKIRSVIDRTYPLEQAAEAHRYAETGQKKGNIVIVVE